MTARKKEGQNGDIAVLYHAECPDGLGAAWAAWKKFGSRAEYIPVYHKTPPPDGLKGKKVYMLDFAYSAPVTEELLATAASLTIIDHHSTNEAVVNMATDALFSLDHSGAVLAWKYFHPGKKIPKLILHIEDMDLWRFHLPHTKELGELVQSYPLEITAFDKLVKGCERKETYRRSILEGKAIMRFADQQVAKAARNAEEIMFEGYRCLMVNATSQSSYVGHALLKKLPPIALVWSRRGKKIVVSLRSDGTVDVAKIAQQYGGGGHQAAAGFSFEQEDFLVFKRLIKTAGT